jgi:hypothetical protein
MTAGGSTPTASAQPVPRWPAQDTRSIKLRTTASTTNATGRPRNPQPTANAMMRTYRRRAFSATRSSCLRKGGGGHLAQFLPRWTEPPLRRRAPEPMSPPGLLIELLLGDREGENEDQLYSDPYDHSGQSWLHPLIVAFRCRGAVAGRDSPKAQVATGRTGPRRMRVARRGVISDPRHYEEIVNDRHPQPLVAEASPARLGIPRIALEDAIKLLARQSPSESASRLLLRAQRSGLLSARRFKPSQKSPASRWPPRKRSGSYAAFRKNPARRPPPTSGVSFLGPRRPKRGQFQVARRPNLKVKDRKCGR